MFQIQANRKSVDPTVTDLANSCATPLFRRPQGSQGCLDKQNYPLSFKFGDLLRYKRPKTKKVPKNSEMKRKTSKNYGFVTCSLKFLGYGPPISAHEPTKFELSGQFCFTRHPWGPWGRQSSGMKPKSAVIWVLVKKFVFFKLMPDVTFIILHA